MRTLLIACVIVGLLGVSGSAVADTFRVYTCDDMSLQGGQWECTRERTIANVPVLSGELCVPRVIGAPGDGCD